MLGFLFPKDKPKCFEYVGALALSRGGIPQIYIFEEAGREFGFSRSKIKRDFEQYLQTGCAPHYVVKFCKKRVSPADIELLRLYRYKVG